jgi:hypothetical protein
MKGFELDGLLTLDGEHTIEVVRGRPDRGPRDGLVRFWRRWSGLDEQQARVRIDDAVCVLIDAAGEPVGISSAAPQPIPLLGGRTLWLYRMLLRPDAPEGASTALLRASRDQLEREFAEQGGGPIGVCVPIADLEILARHPEAVWEETKMIYAGYTDAGVQIRVSYFEGATV